MATYRASKTQVSGRQGWVAVFRHPVRKDKTGKVYRVRAGLSTRDEAEADQLISQLDELLQDESYWNLGARDLANRRFDQRVVNIFFENITSSPTDPWETREAVIPLPGLNAGYSKVRLVGQTGAGKTTLLRQLIGSDPKRDRFPSTSAAKTTTCDIEIVIASEPVYRAVVTFMSQDLARNYVKECVVPATVAAAEGASSEEVSRKLLEHIEQRFRLSYILGSPLEPRIAEEALEHELEDDLEEFPSEPETSELSQEDRLHLHQKLADYVSRIKDAGRGQKGSVIRELELSFDQSLTTEEQDTIQDLLEENIQDIKDVERIVDDIMDDIEDRFDLLRVGELERNKVDWPMRWVVESDNREMFIKAVNRFTSNYAPNFGRLLTPLVQGIRVQGPFKPTWYEGNELPRLVLMDGEGLGHTPETVASLSTSVTQSYEKADVILLVDKAVLPMQAATMAVLQSVCTGGHQSKLALAFTHFDGMTGDNFRSAEDRRKHIQSSLRNGINTLRETLGSPIVRSLERTLETKTFFLTKVQKPLSERLHSTRQQLLRLLETLRKPTRPEKVSDYHPLYDVANLAIAVRSATEKFQDEWRSRLLAEHWTRVKALSRRVAVFQQDQYDTLRPVADLIRLLSEHLTPFVTNPRGWRVPPSDEIRTTVLDQIRQSIYSQLHGLAFQRICQNYIREWLTAYELHGTGTARVRAQRISNIYELAVPIPGGTPRLESSQLLDEVRRIFQTAAETVGAKLS